MGTAWKEVDEAGDEEFVGTDRATDTPRWTAPRTDLVFGSNAQLRVVSEVYAAADAGDQCVRGFVAGWARVLKVDRFKTGIESFRERVCTNVSKSGVAAYLK